MPKYINKAARFDAELEEKLKDQWLESDNLIVQPNIVELDGDEDAAEIAGKVNEIISALVSAGVLEQD